MSRNSNTPVIQQAGKALDKFKYEIAAELGFKDWVNNPTSYYGYVNSRDNGAIGGHMVRRMVEAAERSLIEQSIGQLNAGFTQGFNQASSNAFAPQSQAPSVGSPATTYNSGK